MTMLSVDGLFWMVMSWTSRSLRESASATASSVLDPFSHQMSCSSWWYYCIPPMANANGLKDLIWRLCRLLQLSCCNDMNVNIMCSSNCYHWSPTVNPFSYFAKIVALIGRVRQDLMANLWGVLVACLGRHFLGSETRDVGRQLQLVHDVTSFVSS